MEIGWKCSGAPSVCTAVCSDFKVMGNEQCDDGNLVDFDGCTTACEVETGWNCSFVPGTGSTCNSICGDGYIRQYEMCDDSNTVTYLTK